MQRRDSLQEDLLCAAFLPGAAAVAAWQRWRASVDWETHLDADAFALLPAVYRNLRRLGADDPLLPRLKGIVRQSWLHNQQRISTIDDSLTRCAATAEIVLLPPTSLLLFDTTAVLRPTQPHQWAVAPRQAEAAIRCLYAAGWRSRQVSVPPALLAGYVRGVRYLFLEHDDQSLTLLWGLEHWFGDRAEMVWQRARAARFGKHALRSLDATDTLELVLRQPQDASWLRRATEVLTICSTGEIEWGRLRRELRSWPLPPALQAALQFLNLLLTDNSGAPAHLEQLCGERPAPTPTHATPQNWWGRARQDWHVYRRSWGGEYRAGTALLQLPGYLMARWRLAAPAQLARGAYGWLRYDAK